MKVTHVPSVSDTRLRVSQEMVVTLHEPPPTTPTLESQRALSPPGHWEGWQQCAKEGFEAFSPAIEHQPARAATRLPPGHVPPPGQTRHVLSQP